MTQDTTVVPAAAHDPALTAVERFNMIVRAQSTELANYSAPQSDALPTVGASGVPRQVIEHAQYLERSRDKKGMVPAEKYVAGGVPFTHGYDIPAGYAVDPVGMKIILECAARARVPKDHVFNFLVEFGKMDLTGRGV